jgi:hypothetical protein
MRIQVLQTKRWVYRALKAEVCVQLVFVVFVRTDLFVEQNRRTKTQYVGPLTNGDSFLYRCLKNGAQSPKGLKE